MGFFAKLFGAAKSIQGMAEAGDVDGLIVALERLRPSLRFVPKANELKSIKEIVEALGKSSDARATAPLQSLRNDLVGFRDKIASMLSGSGRKHLEARAGGVEAAEANVQAATIVLEKTEAAIKAISAGKGASTKTD